MKILYIDPRRYTHNADLHIAFIAYMKKKRYHQIIAYGPFMEKHLGSGIHPSKNPNKELKYLVNKHRPDCIISYNANGSSYELGLDNVHLYEWCADFLSRTDVPKFHFSTDLMRSGPRQDQIDWFKDLNYTASFVRHKASLKYDVKIPTYWVPFSVDKDLYEAYSWQTIKTKYHKVGFIGAAHNSSKRLYENRIAAIDFLLEKNKLSITKIVDYDKFTRKMLFGKDYIEFLTQNLFGLTCGGSCNYMTAKYFQIPAARSLLVCTDTEGLELFPKDTYIKYDKNNLNKMYDEIIYHENNLKEAKNKINTLHEYVVENHSHHQRILEMTELIKKHI